VSGIVVASAGSNATAAVANMTVALFNPSIVGIQPLGDLAVSVIYEVRTRRHARCSVGADCAACVLSNHR